MFLILNNKIKENKAITVSDNNTKVKNAFVTINNEIKENQLIIKNNKIDFEGKSEFIVDTNKPQLNIYANMEFADMPRNTVLNENEVELFMDLKNNLSYVNDKNEKTILTQGVVEK